MARIVVVEDDGALRNDLGDKLTDWKHEVMLARSIEEGQAAIEIFRPDIVLSDINMPSGSGFLLCDKMSDRSIKYPGMSFIFISAMQAPLAVAYGFDCGADDYVVKPIDYGQLRETIEFHLNKKQKSWSSSLLKRFA